MTELKKKIIELLERDKEFRYMVAGLVGYKEILDRLAEHDRKFNAIEERIKAIEERIEAIEARIEELSRRIEEHSKILEEHSKRLEELSKRIEERSKRIEELSRRIEEHSKRLEELSKRIEEHSKRIEGLEKRVEEHSEMIGRLSCAVEKLAAQVTALCNRYGVASDEEFRDSMTYVIRDLLKVCKVERWVYYDSEGVVYGHPSIIEVDVLIRDDQHVLVEFKSSIDRGDVTELYRIGVLYEKVVGRKPKLLMVSPSIRRRAKELAQRLGIEVRGVVSEF